VVVACTPHSGYGTALVRQGALVRVVDLATCRTVVRRRPPPSPARDGVMLVATRSGNHGTQAIRVGGRTVYLLRERYDRIPAGAPGPIELFGLTPDRGWVLFAVDPQGSASLAADGLTLQAVSVHGGRPRTIAAGLLAPDYRAWCGGRLVMTAGGDRVAAHHKWLIVAQPPLWRARRLVSAPGFAFGSLACRGNGVVVQAAPAGGSMNPRWQLWSIGLDGGVAVLDRPPHGFSDDSPRVAGGKVVFVRSHAGNGTLYGLGTGPLLRVGHDDGFYGHRPWSAVGWSVKPP
jgi:hypothetical protein